MTRLRIGFDQAVHSDRIVFLWLMVAGLAARLVCLALFDPLTNFAEGDAPYYLSVAFSLAETGEHFADGAMTAYRPPGYPTFLSLIMTVDDHPYMILGVQSALSIMTALLTFALSKGESRPLAALVALLIVTSPFLIVYDYKIGAESLYISFIWIAWLLLFKSLSSGRGILALIAGLLLGLAILTRETFLFITIFSLPMALLSTNPRRMVRSLVVASITSLLVITPWMIRNTSVPGAGFAISEGRFGFNLWVGTWERDGDWVLPGVENAAFPSYAFDNASEERALRTALRHEDDAAFKNAALSAIAHRPLTVAKAWITRYPRLWVGTRTEQIAFRLERGSLPAKAAKAALYLFNFLLLAGAAIGLVTAVRARSNLTFFALPILYTAAIYVPFHNVETRYSLVAFPFLVLFLSHLVMHSLTVKKSKI